MKFKKIMIAFMLCGIFLSAQLFSMNTQKIQDIGGDVDEAIAYLLISQGKTPGSETKPYSNSEILNMLHRIDYNELDDSELAIYGYILDVATEVPQTDTPGCGLTMSTDVALELYAHSDTDYIGRDKWSRGWNETEPFVNFQLDILPADNFYLYTEFPLENYRVIGTDKILKTEDFGSQILMSNIPMFANLKSLQVKDLSFEFPLRAFGAAGGDNWSLEVGKDRISWGNGMSGNFLFGDHIRFHNMARFTTFSPVFKYTFITSFFSHPSAYQLDSDSDGYPDTVDLSPGDSENEMFSGIKMLMAHRFEWNPFDNFNFTLSEGVMYQNEENLLDLRMLNPIALYHNYYVRSYANSLLLLEANYTPIKHVNVYGGWAIDEFVLPGEPTALRPKSWGMMLGVKGALPMYGGIAFASIEGVKTDPYLYLRDGVDYRDYDGATDDYTNYSIDYVVAIRDWNDKVIYDPQFVGYKYGGDAMVLNLNGGFKKFNDWSSEVNIFYMLHGSFDIYSIWKNNKTYTTPTETNDNGSLNPDADVKNAVSRTLVAGVNGSYQLQSNTKVYGQLDFVHIVNPKNNSNNSDINDLQLSTGIKYHF